MKQIDRTKLPQDSPTQTAYADLLPIEEYARNYAPKWAYAVPKEQVLVRFSTDLATLQAAQLAAPENGELRLLTGLVAHLAYNLEIESAYGPALHLLQEADAHSNDDFRPSWFLGMHECESNDSVGGMKRLLQDESAHANLPPAFWRDYMLCAQVASMPAHVMRAYDLLRKQGGQMPEDTALAEVDQARFKPSSISASYPKKEAWQADEVGDRVRFTSMLCGMAFLTKPSFPIDVADVKDGTCAVTITPGSYRNRHGESTPSLLVLTKSAKPEQTLESFLHSFLSRPIYKSATPITGVPCPVAVCLAYEIITDQMYATEGGAHLLAIAFASEQPVYPGLVLEVPHPPPSGTGKIPQYSRANAVWRRFEGRVYTFVASDANADIYTQSRADLDALLKSMVIDSK